MEKELTIMNYTKNGAENVKIAYIGGGSRGWAWGLMSDLAECADMSGQVALYDIDFEAAKNNEVIGNKFNTAEGAKSHWDYTAVETIGEALTGADFVVISILPATFDEMASDVHTPEKYGIYQSVGDTTGPGGIIRAMRTLPMFEEIAKNIKKYCPEAWVINYTNPMTLCVKALYYTFPEIKAFGCCHEVFGTQKFIVKVLKNKWGAEIADRREIKVNPVGVNHFTWLTSATYNNQDVVPVYLEYCKENEAKAIRADNANPVDDNWMNGGFQSTERVKMDLANKFGYIAAAGDRHLAEFCEGKWYLENPDRVFEMGFGLTTVDWRKDDLQKRLARSARLLSGEEEVKIKCTGEEGVEQMRALLGLCDLVTNINIPNRGQIPNLPLGAVVESNAAFRSGEITPVFAGAVPAPIYPLVSRICAQQEMIADGIEHRDLNKIFMAFANDQLVTCGINDAKKLFDEMCQNTKEYLTMYDL